MFDARPHTDHKSILLDNKSDSLDLVLDRFFLTPSEAELLIARLRAALDIITPSNTPGMLPCSCPDCV